MEELKLPTALDDNDDNSQFFSVDSNKLRAKYIGFDTNCDDIDILNENYWMSI
ncbi:5582_t:CDS:2 [Cetraspora pellucida]|uniref:5582_t:CDS:1 n=1 Tax=Cetraspora pellucida TaxID=1433469 RepID=A0A9N8YWX1_9GLOM|nr:5582_t:CDS:2 [Cetraspora pellucida]